MADQIDEKDRGPVYDGNAVREGGGPLDNLVVLGWSLALAVVIGVVIVGYFVFWYQAPTG